jgi:hypothetical protein
VAKRQAQGHVVAVVPYEALRDEFNGGRTSAHAIKRFVTHAYRNWDTRFVVLVGDAAAEDPQNLWGGTAKDWLPTMMARSPIAVAFGGEIGFETIPMDAWYGWCVDPGCVDPSLQPKLHDLYVGRLPVNSLQQARDVVAKLVAYEDVGADQTWRRQMVLHSDDLYSGETFGDLGTSTYCKRDYEIRFSTLNDACRRVIVDEAGLRLSEPETFDMRLWLAGEPVVGGALGDTCRPDRPGTQTRTRATVTPALLTRLSAGRLWWNYQGHANEHLLAHENVYYTRGSADDWRALANDGKPFLFSAFSCHANHFGRVWESDPADGPCVGEELVVAPSKGAIAAWASSGFEIIPSSTTQHINVELARALFSMPPPDTVVRMRDDRTTRVVLGEAIALALLRWHPQVRFDPYQRDVGLTYVLLGDPATRVSIGAPQSFVTANGAPVTPGQPVRLRTVGDTLTLVADLVSNTAIGALRVERTAAGVRDTLAPAAYTLTPAFPDTAIASRTDGRRYTLRHHTTLLAQPYAYTFFVTDRLGVTSSLTADLPFTTVLRVNDQPVNDGDAVPPGATLTLLVLSPAPIPDPVAALALSIDGAAQPFQAVAHPGDPSQREWILSWTGPAALGDYEVRLGVNGLPTQTTHRFAVTVAGAELRLADAMLFPNPFEDDLGAFFSFNLESGSDADVLVRVYTATGRLVYRRFERGLAPGYHQLAWDGRDAEGDKLANGVYFYRLQASNGTTDVTHEGRIVKLRKPRREAEPAATP